MNVKGDWFGSSWPLLINFASQMRPFQEDYEGIGNTEVAVRGPAPCAANLRGYASRLFSSQSRGQRAAIIPACESLKILLLAVTLWYDAERRPLKSWHLDVIQLPQQGQFHQRPRRFTIPNDEPNLDLSNSGHTVRGLMTR
ncbi:conserved hypothetical protein [Coccidioides posadasii str. Silveira]|uniref:Uncharacterized protein n=1 Tax=Coccidioides posadasii (strain RMSCC 757 / Silveira) TaxID=443226 RepID=E9CVC6_COCPS|nr:conserved hypothetical protein [Coccidioides posadasii str. Silveira]